jgi:hypothetical protein
MKTIPFTKFLFLSLILAGFATSCVQDDDYDVPNTDVKDIEIPGTIVSIESVLGEFAQNDNEQFTFSETNQYLEGYVISSDEAGNFFREIILQNKPENPTAGIKVALFVNSLFTRYQVGQKIYVGLDGFTIGVSNGVVTLGVPDGNFIDEAPAQFEKQIIRSTEIAEIVPLPISINQFSDAYENIFIQLDNVQFTKAQIDANLSFASESEDSFDGERILESCTADATTTLSTSTFADFKGLKLPKGSGTLNGVLSRDYRDEKYVIAINSPADYNMNAERCDPLTYDCGIAATQGSQNILNEDFEAQANGPANISGWVNYAEAGSRSWEVFTDSENVPSMGKAVRMQAFNSGDQSNIAWLITPQIDFDTQDNETLMFDTSNSFSDDSNLRVMLSTNWDGDVNTINDADWGELSAATVVDDGEFYKNVVSSGVVDLSCIEGKAYIAFKYIGSTQQAQDGTYELNNITVDFE